MNSDFSLLADPETQTPLHYADSGILISSSGSRYPIANGIPRFVASDNYARAFGAQWKRFSKTQLDSHTGLTLSEDRLARCFRTHLRNLQGKLVLEAGSGAGRFTEILLKYGAIVHSFDYSNAVEANAGNNGSHPDLTLVQADIRKIPFPRSSYDFVVCLGVLQHTPSPEDSIMSLWSMLKPGGTLIIDHYRWRLRNYMPPPLGVAGVVYRPIVLKIPYEQQFAAVKAIFDFWFPILWGFKESKLMQLVLSRLSPIVMYYPHFGLRDRAMYYEWMLLDTHDAMTDFYKHRRSPRRMKRFLRKLSDDVIVTTGGNGLEAWCRKPL